MHPKIAEIIASLSSDHSGHFKAFKELEPNRFIVKTPLAESSDHITYFTFEITNDVLRLEMSHIFGSIDYGNNLEGKDLLELLIENNGTFRMTDKRVRSALIHRSYASGSSGKRWLEAFLYSSYDPNFEEEDPVKGLIMSSDGYIQVGEPDRILLPAVKIMVAKATRSGRRA